MSEREMNAVGTTDGIIEAELTFKPEAIFAQDILDDDEYDPFDDLDLDEQEFDEEELPI